MKKLSYLIVLALILGLVLTGCLLSNVGQVPTTEQSGITYLTKGSSSDLVGLWHFDEGTGITANDSSVSGNTGTLVNGPLWEAGKFGMALNFNGIDEYVDFGAAVDNSITTGITLEAWIKYSDTQNGGIISNDLTWISKKGYDFFLENGKLGIDVGNGTVVGRVLYTMPTPDPVWHHVAATWDGSTVRLYVDGDEVGTPASLSGNYSSPNQATYAGRINSPIYPQYTYPFNGLIDEVRIWDGALTEAQIQQSYALGTEQLDATVVELGEELFPNDQVVIFTSSFYELDGTCPDPSDTIDIYMMSNYGETISGVSPRNKLYTPNRTEGCWGNVIISISEGTSVSVDVGKDDCKSIHLSLDLTTSGRMVGFNAQFLPYD